MITSLWRYYDVHVIFLLSYDAFGILLKMYCNVFTCKWCVKSYSFKRFLHNTFNDQLSIWLKKRKWQNKLLVRQVFISQKMICLVLPRMLQKWLVSLARWKFLKYCVVSTVLCYDVTGYHDKFNVNDDEFRDACICLFHCIRQQTQLNNFCTWISTEHTTLKVSKYCTSPKTCRKCNFMSDIKSKKIKINNKKNMVKLMLQHQQSKNTASSKFALSTKNTMVKSPKYEVTFTGIFSDTWHFAQIKNAKHTEVNLNILKKWTTHKLNTILVFVMDKQNEHHAKRHKLHVTILIIHYEKQKNHNNHRIPNSDR